MNKWYGKNRFRVSTRARKPDVQIRDRNGRTRKVFEAEREPNSRRVQEKKEEYKRLGIEAEFYDLKGNKQP